MTLLKSKIPISSQIVVSAYFSGFLTPLSRPKNRALFSSAAVKKSPSEEQKKPA
jgi:hypothetical protein